MQVASSFSDEFRHAVRGLAHARAFTVTAAVVLALGIGAVTTMFSVTNAVVLRPLPFEDPDELFDIRKVDPAGAVWRLLAKRVESHRMDTCSRL